MESFYDQVPPEDAVEMERLARLMYELRCNRDSILQSWNVADEAALLALLEAGQVDEHPAYEHYLSVRILERTRLGVRALLDQRVREINAR